MITLAGKKYFRNEKEQGQEQAAGFYRTKAGGILFLGLDHKPFAFAAHRGADSWFVTAGRDEASGRTRYMFGLSEIDERRLGIDHLSYSEQRRAASELFTEKTQEATA